MWVSRSKYHQLKREHELLMDLKKTYEEVVKEGSRHYNLFVEGFKHFHRDVVFESRLSMFQHSIREIPYSVLHSYVVDVLNKVLYMCRVLSSMIPEFKLSVVGDINHRIIFYLSDAVHNLPSLLLNLDSHFSARKDLLCELFYTYKVLFALIKVKDVLVNLTSSYELVIDSAKEVFDLPLGDSLKDLL